MGEVHQGNPEVLERRGLLIGTLLTFGFFSLYLDSATPTVAPFRDAGELSTAVPSLGILHPTSYPAYTLLGFLFTQLPLGNPAYRLNVFSGACLALAWGLFFGFLRRRFSSPAAFLITLLAGLSIQFWTHACVAEMYTLHILALSAVLLAIERRAFAVAGLVAGVALANRVDFLLCLPALLIFLWSVSDPDRPTTLRLFAITSLAGLLLYLYLPFRAVQQPLLNWNDPSTLSSFIGTITRRGYGRTLDLLSASYKPGENFGSETILYFHHAFRDFGYVLVPLVLMGLVRLWRSNRGMFWTGVVGHLITGPVFIFLGNLPSNPHAVAIMESAYLVPDFFLLIIAAAGLNALLVNYSYGLRWALVAVGSVTLLVWASTLASAISRRRNFMADDYQRNVYHSVEPHSVIVSRSDVPVFALYYGHWVQPGTISRIPLAQGLVSSPWYERMISQQVSGLAVSPLRTTSDWDEFRARNASWRVYATYDIDWPTDGPLKSAPKGLVSGIQDLSTLQRGEPFPFDVYRHRSPPRAHHYADFFSQEVADQYARAWLGLGEYQNQRHDWENAAHSFRQALTIKRDLPYAVMGLAYTYFATGHYAASLPYYRWASRLFENLEQQAIAWKALEPARRRIARDHAQVLTQQGVAQERLGQDDRSKVLYEQGLAIDPTSADALYNLAVLYWKRSDWKAVISHLQALAQAHPEDDRWKQYLPAALARYHERVQRN